MKRIFFFFFLWIPFAVTSQDGLPDINISNIELSNSNDVYFLFYPAVENDVTQKKNYLEEKWEESVIRSYKDEFFNVYARYHLEDGQIHILKHGDTKVLFSERIKAIKIGSRLFVPNHSNLDHESLPYGEVLLNGKISLLKYYEFASDLKPMRYKTGFFIQQKNKPAKKIKLTKKSLLQILNKRKEEIKLFINSNNINSKSEAGWIQTLEYYNHLK